MPIHIALLRAVNVGGTSTIPMAELRSICERLGFTDVKTYIQSGNVLFRSELSETEVRQRLEDALAIWMGKTPGVILRSRRALEEVVAKAPFPDAKPNFLLVTFLPEPPAANALEKLVAPDGEEVRIEGREIFIHYPNGSGRSKLKLPALTTGTARSLNTVRKLAELAAALEDENS